MTNVQETEKKDRKASGMNKKSGTKKNSIPDLNNSLVSIHNLTIIF